MRCVGASSLTDRSRIRHQYQCWVWAREAIIAGRHLLKLYDLISHHRVAWVRELPKGKDFMDKGQTVITSITLNRIKEVPA
jgi:hypothetical protein